MDLKIQLPALRTDNWSQWRCLAENYFRANNLWEIVSGNEVEPQPIAAVAAAPPADDENAPRAAVAQDPVAQFRKKKHTAMFLLMASLSPPVYRLVQIQDTGNPSALWHLLVNHFEHRSRMSVLQVISALSKLRYESGKPSEWITARSRLYDELAASGERVSNSMQVSATLLLLPSPAWDTVRSLVTSAQDRATVANPYTLENLSAQLDDEWRLRGGQDSSGGQALVVRGQFQKRGVFRGRSSNRGRGRAQFRGGASGSSQSGQRQSTNRGNPNPPNGGNSKCYNCGGIGHWADKCSSPPQHGQRSGARLAHTSDTSQHLGFAASAFLRPGQILIDSGASQHMTNIGNSLINYRTLKNPIKVRVANNQVLMGIGVGDLPLLLTVHGRQIRQNLLNCLHVPELSATLLSIRAADLNGLSATFANGSVELLDASGTLRCRGHLKNGCYLVDGRICGHAVPYSNSQKTKVQRCGIAESQPITLHRQFSRVETGSDRGSDKQSGQSMRVVCPVTTNRQCFPQGQVFGEPPEVDYANRSCAAPIFSANSVGTDAEPVVTAHPNKSSPPEAHPKREINYGRDTLDVPEKSTRYIIANNCVSGGQILASRGTVDSTNSSPGEPKPVLQASNGISGTVAHKSANDGSMRNKFPLLATRHPLGVPSGKSSIYLSQGRVVAPQVSVGLWHRRLAHLGLRDVHRLLKQRLVTDMSCNSADTPDICEPCAIGKSQRIPFPHSASRRAKAVLELVHSDVAGPTKTQSIGKAHYFVTLIDDYSRMSFVRFVRHKAEVASVLRTLILELENQTDSRVKTIRTDRGGEYVSRGFEQFLADKGIRHEVTIANSPQQNGVAERYNGVIAQKARTMLTESGLPPKFWAEAVSTANYLRNLSPTASNPKFYTPYQRWFRRRPSLKHLRVFGSVVYSNLQPSERQSKFSPRAEKGYLLGYSSVSKGFRVWFPSRGRVLERRDLLFDESSSMRTEIIQPVKLLPVQEELLSNPKQPKVTIEEEKTDDADRLLQDIDAQLLLQLPLQIVPDEQESILPVQHPVQRVVPPAPIPAAQPLALPIPQPGLVPAIQPNQGVPIQNLPVADPRPVDPAEVVPAAPGPVDPVDVDSRRVPPLIISCADLLPPAAVANPPTLPTAPETSELHRSQRTRKAPSWFGEYFAKTASIDDTEDPKSWSEAVKSEHAQEWKDAAQAEINSLDKFGVWTLVDRPPQRKIVGCRWVFRTKKGEHGEVLKFKARLVAKGFTQQYGFDYSDTFAPVI